MSNGIVADGLHLRLAEIEKAEQSKIVQLEARLAAAGADRQQQMSIKQAMREVREEYARLRKNAMRSFY